MVKKIVVLGPESTGKSTLCALLASHFNTGWAKEYAREYLEENGPGYTYNDLLDIAKGQLRLEDEAADLLTSGNEITGAVNPAKPNLLFIDTDMYVLKVWCEFVFGQCHPWILNQVVNREYHLYLLCDIDLPWVKDELREYPNLVTREKLYYHYKDAMINQQVPWVNINGNYDDRLQKAIEAVNKFLL